MATIFEKISNLPEEEFPVGLHKEIQKAIRKQRIKSFFYPVGVILLMNFLLSLVLTIKTAVDADLGTVLTHLGGKFEFSSEYFSNIFYLIWNSGPTDLRALIFYVLEASFVAMLFWLYYKKFNKSKSVSIKTATKPRFS